MTDRLLIAVDPSIVKPGWAVLRVPSRIPNLAAEVRALYVDSGQWGTKSSDPMAERLAYLGDECRQLCDRYPPWRAIVEEPAIAGVYNRNRGKGDVGGVAIMGKSLAMMQRSVGVFLAVLGSHCPTETVKANNPLGSFKRGSAKAARRQIVASYWPNLAERPEDEIDAVHMALVQATTVLARRAA